MTDDVESKSRMRAIDVLTDEGRRQLLFAIAMSFSKTRRSVSASQLDHLIMSALLAHTEESKA